MLKKVTFQFLIWAIYQEELFVAVLLESGFYHIVLLMINLFIVPRSKSYKIK
jgi:hypothetical protein